MCISIMLITVAESLLVQTNVKNHELIGQDMVSFPSKGLSVPAKGPNLTSVTVCVLVHCAHTVTNNSILICITTKKHVVLF